MKVGIVGCGLIGLRRAKHLGQNQLVVAADIDLYRARQVASESGNGASALATHDWREAVAHPDAEMVIVATTPDVMPEITLGALRAGKHVLVDKPAARHDRELEPVVRVAKETGRQVRVGFNHRCHPAMKKAHELVLAGAVGELMYIRGRYGHGGRLGYESEWRAQPAISGGGELIDQGMHLIDLSRWFLGEFTEVNGYASTYFWDMPVDDNAFAFLRTARNQVAWLHASWTEWKNLFSFEIFGKTGKLQIDGLGGSYGTETLTFFEMQPQLGPPNVERWEFSGEDLSWQVEFDQFVSDIQAGRISAPNVEDALAALRIVCALYARQVPVAGRAK